MAYITCRVCGFPAPEEWFIQSSFRRKCGLVYQTTKKVCPMCLQEKKDQRKHQNRALTKARDMLYSHTRRYNAKHGTQLKPAQFARKFGWSIRQMVHDIAHNFENWCSYCEEPYTGMGHGLADLTLDIINPDESPFYTNVRYCCHTCNTIKGQRGAAAFGFHLAMVKARREFLNSEHGTLAKPQYKMELVL